MKAVEDARPLMVIGSKLTWLCKAKGTFGHAVRIPCRVLEASNGRVTIEFYSIDGRRVEWKVKRKSLVFRNASETLMRP